MFTLQLTWHVRLYVGTYISTLQFLYMYCTYVCQYIVCIAHPRSGRQRLLPLSPAWAKRPNGCCHCTHCKMTEQLLPLHALQNNKTAVAIARIAKRRNGYGYCLHCKTTERVWYGHCLHCNGTERVWYGHCLHCMQDSRPATTIACDRTATAVTRIANG